jgi:phospholipase D-like protein
MVIATSTFLQVMFGLLIMAPIILLWIAALVDVLRSHSSGLQLAAIIVLILIVPILGPVLYFVFRKPTVSAGDAEAAYLAQADLQRQAASKPVGGAFR